jgi:hypothetical protein
LAHPPSAGTVHWWTLGNVTAATSMGGHFVLYTNGLSAAGVEGHSEATRAGRLTIQVRVVLSHVLSLVGVHPPATPGGTLHREPALCEGEAGMSPERK